MGLAPGQATQVNKFITLFSRLQSYRIMVVATQIFFTSVLSKDYHSGLTFCWLLPPYLVNPKHFKNWFTSCCYCSSQTWNRLYFPGFPNLLGAELLSNSSIFKSNSFFEKRRMNFLRDTQTTQAAV
jgi:hypothetical protein